GGRARSGNRDRSRSRDVEGLLEGLHELAELDEGELLERVEQLLGAELRHDVSPVGWGFGGRLLTASYAAVSCFSRSASTVRTVFDSGAWKRAAAFDIEAFIMPATLASRTSRLSRSASLLTSSGLRAAPSK